MVVAVTVALYVGVTDVVALSVGVTLVVAVKVLVGVEEYVDESEMVGVAVAVGLPASAVGQCKATHNTQTTNTKEAGTAFEDNAGIKRRQPASILRKIK